MEEQRMLWLAVIDSAKKDLTSKDFRESLDAAQYLFVATEPADALDVRTFAGACSILGLNPEAAARKIFRGLPAAHRARVCQILRGAGYSVNPRYLQAIQMAQ